MTFRVLLTNAGRRTYIIENLLSSASERNLEIEIHVCDTSIDNASFWVASGIRHHMTPFVTEQPDEYITLVKKICKDNQIGLLIPLMDFELPLLAEIKTELNSYGTQVMISEKEIVDFCLDKTLTYEFCKKNDILTPEIYSSKEEVQFPAILKRVLGSGSVGLKFAYEDADILDYQSQRDMLQQFIKGQEYGIDIFNDFEGDFQYASMRKKLAMRAGETDKAEVFYDEKLWDYCKNLSQKIRHVGNLDADIIISEDGEIYLIDLNPRFGGGYPFSMFAGIDSIGALMDLTLGNPVKYSFDNTKRYVACKGISVYGRAI